MSERIIDQPEVSALSGDEYLIVDGSTNGTKKIAVDNILAKEVTIETGGEVSQELAPGTIYHFTGSVSVLNITLGQPFAVGPSMYRFDFYSGATPPTLVMPSDIVMPNNFMVEPNAKYELNIFNGYCVANKWADNHSPFIYLDSENGDFTMNSSAITSGKVYANVGTEVVSINLGAVKIKNAIDHSKYLKICDISSQTKALIGSTYVTGTMPLWKSGKTTYCIFNTWQDNAVIEIQNSTGETIPAGTEIGGVMFVLRTI